MTSRLGVCSWSLRPRGPRGLVEAVHACELDAVQLALDPLRRGEWNLQRTIAALDEAGIEIASGMISFRGEDYSTPATIRETGGVRSDAYWNANAAAAEDNARLARELDLELVSFHAGHLPGDGNALVRRLMVERLRTVVDAFAAEGVRVALETGQEDAETLLSVLQEIDRPDLGVNFDPANLLLYGTDDPHDALSVLAPHVAQVHLKDAMASHLEGLWGDETPLGEGDIDWPRLFAILEEEVGPVDLLIEREEGDDRVADVRRAARYVRSLASEAR